jgi:hypothetical protein
MAAALLEECPSSVHTPSVDLTVLGHVVQVGTLPARHLERVGWSLLRLLFCAERARFLQFSIMGGEYSVIGAAEEIKALQQSADFDLQLDPTEWAVVQVSEGESGDSGGVVERIINPLAAASVPVLYMSTASSDFVLIPCDRLRESLGLFEGAEREVAVAGESPGRREPRDSLGLTGSGALPIAYPLTVMPSVHIYRMDKALLQQHTGALLRLLFLPKKGDPRHALRALIETPEELSCVCGSVDWLAEYLQRPLR